MAGQTVRLQFTGCSFDPLKPIFLIFALVPAFSNFLGAAEWTGSCADLSGWIARTHGGADAEANAEIRDGRASIRLTSRSPAAPNAWLSLSSTHTFPVKPGEELVLECEISADRSGNAFAAVCFEPSGSDIRLALPGGSGAWRQVSREFQVPPSAERARIVFGVESESAALWVSGVSVRKPLTKRTGLSAIWRLRPHPRVFPQADAPAGEILALDITSLSPDEQLLATTLQGLINRRQPRLYLFTGGQDRFWAHQLAEEGTLPPLRELQNIKELVEAFRGEIPGVIVDDPALPASRHAAMMIGSLKGWPATGAATAETLRLPVLENLAGRWTKSVDVYRELWTKHRDEFASHIVAVHHPSMLQQGPRDYLFQQKIFTFWVSGPSDNDPGADSAAELDFAHDVLASTPPNIPILGWWSFADGKGLAEHDALSLCSSYAKFLAGSEYGTNLSLLSGVPVKADAFRQRLTPKLPDQSADLAVTFSVIDSGDSQWYWQHYQPKFWQDPARGRTPINWSLNPTVADVMPAVLAWYYRTATPKDLFYCAISGLGYMNPRVYAARFTPADQDRIWTEYTAELSRYMTRLDLDILGVYAGSWGESRAGMPHVYRRFFQGAPSVTAILSDFGRHSDTTTDNAIEVIDGKPVFHTLMRWLMWTKQDQLTGQLGQEERSVAFTVQELLENAPSARPGLMSGLILSWTMSPTLVERVAQKLPADIRPVNADELAARWQSQRSQ